jgi:hypothetical protein
MEEKEAEEARKRFGEYREVNIKYKKPLYLVRQKLLMGMPLDL